jgi:hypothetical protein
VQLLKNAPKVTKLEKRTQSYQTLKTYFDQNKAPLFATQKYSRLKSAFFRYVCTMMYVHYTHIPCVASTRATQHNTQPRFPPPTSHSPPPPISAMTLTPSKLSAKSSINSIGLNEELPGFADIVQDIQNRASHCMGLESMEARLFREFFGMSVRVIKILWELVVRDKLQPRGGRPKLLLWMLYFMKVYLKQGPGCLVVGASAGAVDPKTHRKWVWAFIKAIARLVDVMVSNTTM